MTTTLTAVYEGGVLRPEQPLALPEGTLVQVMILTSRPAPSPQRAAELLAEIASMPIEGKPGRFDSRDHDKILYGEPHPS